MRKIKENTEQTVETTESNGHNPEATAAEVTEAAAPKVAKGPKLNTADEQRLAKMVQDAGQLTLDEIQVQFGDPLKAMSLASKLAGRKILNYTPGQPLTITEGGTKALETFVAPPAKEKKEKAASDFDRHAAMEKKYGPRDPNIGPAPSRREWEEARLANALASLNLAVVGRRMHPYSPKALDKVNKAQERVDIIQKIVNELPAGDGGQMEASAATE